MGRNELLKSGCGLTGAHLEGRIKAALKVLTDDGHIRREPGPNRSLKHYAVTVPGRGIKLDDGPTEWQLDDIAAVLVPPPPSSPYRGEMRYAPPRHRGRHKGAESRTEESRKRTNYDHAASASFARYMLDGLNL